MKCPNRIAYDKMIFEEEDSERPVTVIEKAPTVVVCEDSWDEVSIYYLVSLTSIKLMLTTTYQLTLKYKLIVDNQSL